MPKKIPFTVIYCSGWEDDYPPKDLEVHSPFVKGWRSPRYCLFPQELVIRINPPVRVRKFQLLCHQFMIPSKIDLYIGHLPSDSHASIESAQFKRLGYISLSDNGQTGYLSRELKSTNLDCFGHLIKLVLQSNHINRLNLFNQVCIVALNVIGDPLPDTNQVGVSLPDHVTHYKAKDKPEALSTVVHSYLPSLHLSHDGALDPTVLGAINKSSRISKMDDLGFAVALDPQTADLIRSLDEKKMAAVDEEEFEYAKQLKQVIDELQKIGEVLCRYEVDKKLAVEREDYDTAKEKKTQLDNIRSQIYERLGLQGLLESSRESVRNRSTFPSNQHHDVNRPRSKHVLFNDKQSLRGSSHVDSSILLPQISCKVDQTPSPPTLRTDNSADDRPLPALVPKVEKLDTLEEQLGSSHEPTEDESEVYLEPLTEKQHNEVPGAVEVFGMEWMEHIYAKKYNLREDGLHEIIKHLQSTGEVNRKEAGAIIRATCQVLGKALNDQVVSTFVLSLDLLNYLVGPFCQEHRSSRPDLYSFIVEKVVPILLLRTGDMTSRIHTAAMDTIMELALHPQIKSFSIIGPLLLHPFKQRKKPPWKLAQSRVELLDRLIQNVGLGSSGFTLKNLMEFLRPLLSHPHGNVRDASVKLVHDLYSLNGSEVRRMLPVPDDSTSRRKTLWKTVFEGFDRIDLVPMLAEKEAAMEAAQKAKSEEIDKLQGQMEALRVLVARGVRLSEGKTEAILHQSEASEGIEDKSSDYSSHLSPVQDSATTHNSSLDTTCVFCGEQRLEFAENGMESHYLESCPMLQSCPHCTQVIEICGLTRHWLGECEAKEKFRECPDCKEAILRAQYVSHVGSCKQVRSEERDSICPLCHTQVQDGEEGWKSHLMGSGAKACRKNPRKKGGVAGLNKGGVVKRTGAVAAGTKRTMIPKAVPGSKYTNKKKGN